MAAGNEARDGLESGGAVGSPFPGEPRGQGNGTAAAGHRGRATRAQLLTQLEQLRRERDGLTARAGELEEALRVAQAERDDPAGQVAGLTTDKEAALAEKRELAERLLRLQADFDNHRRRTRQDMEQIRETAAEHLIKELLPVLDNLERALAACQDADDPLAKGVNLVLMQLRTVLAREGLAPIPGLGETFDPHLHEAVAEVEGAPDEGGRIVEELRKGYFLRNKVLRPSMVKVARGR